MESHLVRRARNSRAMPFCPVSVMEWKRSIGSVEVTDDMLIVRPGAKGDAVVERIVELIERAEEISGRYRYPSQRRMMKAFLATLLRFIYKLTFFPFLVNLFFSVAGTHAPCKGRLGRERNDHLLRVGHFDLPSFG